jgi:hypothetical protein
MPKAEKISLLINSACRDLGIDYCSVNPACITLMEDAKKLSKMYLQLKEMIGIIQEIEDRHELNGLKKEFDKLIKILDRQDHVVIQLARKLTEKNV